MAKAIEKYVMTRAPVEGMAGDLPPVVPPKGGQWKLRSFSVAGRFVYFMWESTRAGTLPARHQKL